MTYAGSERQRTLILAARALIAARESVGMPIAQDVRLLADSALPDPSDIARPAQQIGAIASVPDSRGTESVELQRREALVNEADLLEKTILLRRAQVEHLERRIAAASRPRGSLERRMSGEELTTLWGVVLEATSFVTEKLSERLEAGGVSAPFVDVLIRLAREPSQRLAMTKLAKEVSLKSGAFTKLADRMEEEGLLYRQHSAQDRRVIYVVLSDAGRAAAARILPQHVGDLEDLVLAPIGEEDAAELRRIMTTLRDYAAPRSEDGGHESLIETQADELRRRGILEPRPIR